MRMRGERDAADCRSQADGRGLVSVDVIKLRRSHPWGTRGKEKGSMAASAAVPPKLPLDGGQVKKAAQALLAYNKTREKAAEKLLLNEHLNVFLMVTVWKIPPREQVIKITLPHGILPETSEICLFTKDEPGLTAEQTENLYRKLLSQHGIKNITEIISYKTLKAEYKSFEAKRRLLSRFSFFLSDDRIRRLLPSHIGKHFYRSKKAPLCVNLKAKNLATEINRRIQGTVLPVTNKGCCYAARVGHTGMTADEIAENVTAVATAIAAKAPKISKSIKILHLKTNKSVALPVFNCSDPVSGAEQKKKEKKKNRMKRRKEQTADKAEELVEGKNVPDPGSEGREETAQVSGVVGPEQEDDEGIPLLVPIGTATSVQEDKVAEPKPSAKKEATTDPKGLGKRKSSLPLEAPVTELETPKSSPKTSKLLRRGKKARTPEKEVTGKELAKTTPKPKMKSLVNPRKEKAMMSARKAPRTPKQAIGKMKLLQSV